MAEIVIKTQPSNKTVAEFATATFTVVLSGSAADTDSYLSASLKQWYISSSKAAVAGATGLTLTLSNVQESQNGVQYFFMANSASVAGTKVTSSAATLTVTSETEYAGIDTVKTANARYEHLGNVWGYKNFIPLMISSSEVAERYCPHFASKRDMRQFISLENDITAMSQTPTLAAAQQPSRSYNTVWIAESQLDSYSKIGQNGYRMFIPLYYSGSQVLERYCPHFETEHDVQQFVNREVEIGSFNQVLGE